MFKSFCFLLACLICLQCLQVHEGRTQDESFPPTLAPSTPSPPPPDPRRAHHRRLPHPSVSRPSLTLVLFVPVPLSPLSHLSVISRGFSLSSLAHNCAALVRQTHSFHQRAQEGIFLGRALTEKPLLQGTNHVQTSIPPNREQGSGDGFNLSFLPPTL